jgi:copper chaperone
MEQKTIAIQGMSCGHCVASVKGVLGQLNGVEVQEVTVGSAKVSYDPQVVTPETIAQAIEEQGYTAHVAS